jgi:hypothetical protein
MCSRFGIPNLSKYNYKDGVDISSCSRSIYHFTFWEILEQLLMNSQIRMVNNVPEQIFFSPGIEFGFMGDKR